MPSPSHPFHSAQLSAAHCGLIVFGWKFASVARRVAVVATAPEAFGDMSDVVAEQSVEEMRELHAREVQELNDMLEAAQLASEVSCHDLMSQVPLLPHDLVSQKPLPPHRHSRQLRR